MTETYMYVETAPGMFSSEATCSFYDLTGTRRTLVVDDSRIVRASFGKLEALRVSLVWEGEHSSRIYLPTDPFDGQQHVEVPNAILVKGWPYPEDAGRGAEGIKGTA